MASMEVFSRHDGKHNTLTLNSQEAAVLAENERFLSRHGRVRILTNSARTICKGVTDKVSVSQ